MTRPQQAPKFDVSKLTDQDINTLIDRIIENLNARDVFMIHRQSDKDTRSDAIHHTLGSRTQQASPGDHTHDGGTSPQLITATISGSRTTPNSGAVLEAVMQALVPLGLVDATTT